MATLRTAREILQSVIKLSLYGFEVVIRLIIGVNVDFNIPDFIRDQFVVSERETRHGKRFVAFPIGDEFLTVDGLANFIPGGDQLIFFGTVKGKVEIRTQRKFIDTQFALRMVPDTSQNFHKHNSRRRRA